MHMMPCVDEEMDMECTGICNMIVQIQDNNGICIDAFASRISINICYVL